MTGGSGDGPAGPEAGWPGTGGDGGRCAAFPAGAAVTRGDLEGDVHPVLARLRRSEPVTWLPALNGWLVTRRDLALRVLRDSAAFTVDDPRFSTARVVGPSMLSLDGAEHARHRAPFTAGFSHTAVRAALTATVADETARLVARLRPAGCGDLRRDLAGPLAAGVIGRVLGLGDTDPAVILSWYDDIVAAVSALTGHEAAGGAVGGAGGAVGGAGGAQVTAGTAAFALLSEHIQAALAGGGMPVLAGVRPAGEAGGLTGTEVVSNAAVLMFGGIETTEGMITNALLHLLLDPAQLARVTAEPRLVPDAVEESLRLEPAAALVDRYATADIRLGEAAVRRGDLVSVSLAGVGRDPAVFADPDRFDITRQGTRAHLAFAHGPHFCIGAHLARLEAHCAVRAVLRLPGLRLDPGQPVPAARGLLFRKPTRLPVCWDPR